MHKRDGICRGDVILEATMDGIGTSHFAQRGAFVVVEYPYFCRQLAQGLHVLAGMVTIFIPHGVQKREEKCLKSMMISY